MILMIDNYDSFTYNLVQYLGELGENLKVFRNDKVTLPEIKKLNPKRIVISPGPGRPIDAGISSSVIKKFSGDIPILGVCLGHQCIAEVFGGKIVQASRLMHGKVSSICHNGKDIFKKIDNPFEATRYHSLIVEKKSLPKVLEIIAWTSASATQKHSGELLRGVQAPLLKGDSDEQSEERQRDKVSMEVPYGTEVGEIMGLRHKKLPVWGVQFHPESILTIEGKKILKNFLIL
ncbi:MAG TPA: aminodeoxychorismate/anthranilate synthase component II [Candidatus Omnitrophica bacterium]|nr:aminodeoxychorismate/anthranilate synthase component II [Candidatus Omnitrophota bacterium]